MIGRPRRPLTRRRITIRTLSQTTSLTLGPRTAPGSVIGRRGQPLILKQVLSDPRGAHDVPGPTGLWHAFAVTPLPFDPIREAGRQWEKHWGVETAAPMEAVISIVRAQQIVVGRLNAALRAFDLTYSRYETLMLLFNSREGSLGQMINNPDLYNNLSQAAENVKRLTRELEPVVCNAKIITRQSLKAGPVPAGARRDGRSPALDPGTALHATTAPLLRGDSRQGA